MPDFPQLTDVAKALLDGPNICVLTTLRRDGAPASNVMWCGREGDLIALNAGHDVIWLRRLQRNPAVSLAVVDAENALDALTVRGTVMGTRPDVGYENIHALSEVYEHRPYAYNDPETYDRVVVTIRPDAAVALQGGDPQDGLLG